MPGAGIVRNAAIIRGRVLYEEMRYVTTFLPFSSVKTAGREFNLNFLKNSVRESRWLLLYYLINFFTEKKTSIVFFPLGI